MRSTYATAVVVGQAQRSPGVQVVWSKPGRGNARGENSEGDLRRRRPDLNVGLELKYLRDPVKLADRVRFALRDGQVDQAMDLVREASKDIPCTVSWNHLMDYQMQRGRVAASLKTYNEMKKRGQKPDAHTYTLLLRGLGAHTQYPSALGKALSIYHSLFTPKAPVKPSIIHANAVLKVCALSGDMDSLWGIAAKLPDRGPGAADNWTFTTILNAIRHDVEAAPRFHISPEQMAQRKEEAIIKGRRMWEDIVDRWRTGNLRVDEDLTCAMGRLLLIGERPADWDDVFSLVAQTMNVPRLVPRLGTNARAPAAAGLTGSAPDPSPRDLADADNLFRSLHGVDAHGRDRTSTFTYGEPQTQTLSLLLDACSKLRIKKTATDYWELLTDSTTYGIRPDSNNYISYLRLLRFTRASSQATRLLLDEAMHSRDAAFVRKAFRVAMSACVRDRNNPHSLEHAHQLLKAMQGRFSDTDIRTLMLYMQLTTSTDDAKVMLQILDHVRPAFLNLRSQIAYGHANTLDMPERWYRDMSLDLARRMIGCYDRLINRGENNPRVLDHYFEERNRLAAYVTRYNVPGKEVVGSVGKKKKSGREEEGADGVEGGEGRRAERVKTDDDVDETT
ncbi:MAG: hypothetical protein M1838_002069 [Thelocarpon superellum]|nr:MAG: hypothetical protein M1838_002069 [Thelocarpon superellum]